MDAKTTPKVVPVILSGGSGTRLWPLSRMHYPKQFLPLVSDHSLLAETALRAAGNALFAPALVLCNGDHRFAVAEQLRRAGVEPAAIVLEPVARNTGPAVAAAALMAANADEQAVVLVMPSDHVVRDASAFEAAVRRGLDAVSNGCLVTFGISPDAPETGYGYIRQGRAIAGAEGCFAVERFVEKPDRDTAQTYLEEGGYVWNSGVFLFAAKDLIAEMERLAPGMLDGCRAALAGAHRDLDFLRLEAEAFSAISPGAVDTVVMERTDRAAVVPVDMGWSDVGSWGALWEVESKDDAGNVLHGDVVAEDLRGCYVRAESTLVAAVGLENLVVVETADAVLVIDRARSQEVRAVVQRLKDHGRRELTESMVVYRPWGHFQDIDAGERFRVKRIVVKPGAKLSRQMHYHRAEHWVVVSGTAEVGRGEETLLLAENESIYIPAGTSHRLANPGKLPLHVVEVQSGGYLAEDDIVRFDDEYGRI